MDANKVLTQMSTSKFLKGRDIEGKRVKVTISQVELNEQERDGKKVPQFVLHFEKTEKILGLNVGNTEVVIDNLGAESDNWVGKQLTLYTEKTKTPDGNPTLGIRVLKEFNDEEVEEFSDETEKVEEEKKEEPIEHEPMGTVEEQEEVNIDDIPF